MRNDFAAFILTHGRADRVYTYDTLMKCNYTGNIYIIIDDEDEQEELYIKKYGKDRVIKFCKQEQIDKVDTMDNHDRRKVILYARNACFDIAKKLGIRYFLELDDDYTDFDYRFVQHGVFRGVRVKQFDRLCEAMIKFLDDTQAQTVAFCQAGDFIGGAENGRVQQRVLRKAMNTFFCDAERPFQFIGAINEDVNMYTKDGSMGKLIMSVVDVAMVQKQTQSNAGGMTDVYLDSGTYIKSFYTTMLMPSCVTVQMMGESYRRMHHSVRWQQCVPMIINEKYRKAANYGK